MNLIRIIKLLYFHHHHYIFDTITEESCDLSTLYTHPYLNDLNFDYTVAADIPYSNTVMDQRNLHIILKPKLRGMNYAITINAHDSNFQISNLQLELNITEIPAIKFKEESGYTDLYFNTKTITIKRSYQYANYL